MEGVERDLEEASRVLETLVLGLKLQWIEDRDGKGVREGWSWLEGVVMGSERAEDGWKGW